jgi:hypothetical protein
MAAKRNSRKSRTIGPAVPEKPNGVIQPRVQAVGPEHFGIVAVDCAKARSKWMLCDFYGRLLVPPTTVEHQRTALQVAALQLQEACGRYGLRDHVVAIEMTGTYHRPVQRAFRKAADVEGPLALAAKVIIFGCLATGRNPASRGVFGCLSIVKYAARSPPWATK